VPLSKIAQVLGVTLKDISILNPSYKQLMINGTAAVPRKLIIPQIEKERFAALTQVLNNPDGPVPFVRTQPVYTASVQPKQVPVSVIAQAASNAAASSTVATEPARVLPAFYITQKGDTFTGIASKYGVNVDELMKLNVEFGNSKTVHLQPGLTIKITRG
jgi:membrane-bound lytic murein transglycosylase D